MEEGAVRGIKQKIQEKMLRAIRERRKESVVGNVERMREQRDQGRTGFVPDVISCDGQIGIKHTVTVLLRIHIRSACQLHLDLFSTATTDNCNNPFHTGLDRRLI